MKRKKVAYFTLILAGWMNLNTFNSLQVHAQDSKDVVKKKEKDTKDVETLQVVTARRRKENINEIPMSISNIQGREITERNLINTQDFFRTIAGGASPTGGALILRGLSGSNATDPGTVGYWTDDIPFNFTDLYDIERVEVLRGPQGTLFGSNAVGGTVRVITNKPNFTDVIANGSLQMDSTQNTIGTGQRAYAALNYPFTDDLALRVTASSAYAPYAPINVYTGVQSYKRNNYVRAQLAYRWEELLDLNFSYYNVNTQSMGNLDLDRSKPGRIRNGHIVFNKDSAATYGYSVDSMKNVTCNPELERHECYNQGELIRGPKKYKHFKLVDDNSKTKTELYGLNLKHENSYFNAVYSGSFRKNYLESVDNWSELDTVNMLRAWIFNDGSDPNKRYTNELRLQGHTSHDFFSLDWVLGTFHDTTHYAPKPKRQREYIGDREIGKTIFNYWYDLEAEDIDTISKRLYGNNDTIYGYSVEGGKDKENTYYGDASFVLNTDSIGNFEISPGIRFYRLENTWKDATTGVFNNDYNVTDVSELAGVESGNRKKLAFSWRPDKNQSIYTLYSEGYRPGYNNGPVAGACYQNSDDTIFLKGFTKRVKSDKIKNYELGWKGSLLDRKINFGFSGYQIDWTDVQILVTMPVCGFSFGSNAANAISRGAELESQTAITSKLMFTLNAGYIRAKLKSDVTSLGAKAGDEMTMVPRYNIYSALDQEFRAFDKTAYVRFEVNAYGKYKSHFLVTDADRTKAYEVYNLSSRLHINDNTQLGFYVNNLFNREVETYKRGRLRNPSQADFKRTVNYSPERTYLLRLNYTF